MPRKRRAAFEVAVAASPLFKLPLEVRTMIYELLLIPEDILFIPSDLFKRRRHPKTVSKPQQCLVCQILHMRNCEGRQHIPNLSNQGTTPRRPYSQWLPEVNISLLRTCRLIRLEASPILYSKNRFCFSDPAAANNFRWVTDSARAGATQEVMIVKARPASWMAYFVAGIFSFGQDFPNLRRLTIDARWWFEDESLRFSQGLRGRLSGLDWLLLMLHNEKLLDHFEPLLERKDDSRNGQKEVQRLVWENRIGVGIKNALLWWGAPGETLPHKYKMIGDQTL